MILQNSRGTLRFVYNETLNGDKYPHYDIYSYNAFIGTFYVCNKHLVLMDNYIDYSRTTNIHYKLAIGWAIYYFGTPIMKVANEWSAVKCNAPSIYYIRKLNNQIRDLCGIRIEAI